MAQLQISPIRSKTIFSTQKRDGDSPPAGVADPQDAAAMPRRLQSSAPPLDNDDILEEILLRLPPLPSSLPRASLVSKRWRRLVSDPRFVRRFRAHHRTPPLLGFYVAATFVPALDPPDRIPAARFSLDPQGDEAAARRKIWTCCQGLLLGLDNRGAGELQVFDPMSGHRSRVPFPAYYRSDPDMLCMCIAATAIPHAGSGDRRLFRIVTLFRESWTGGGFVSVYSSDSGEWEDPVAALPNPNPNPNPNDPHSSLIFVRPGIIVGNAIYWTSTADQVILEFDLDSQSLTVIELPPDAHVSHGFKCQIMPTEDGQLGLAVLVKSSIQFWEEINRGRGPTARWLLRKTIQSDSFLPQVFPQRIAGFAEESKVMFLATDDGGMFMVHLDMMKSRKVLQELTVFEVFPYSSF